MRFNLRCVDLENAAASEHGNVKVSIVIDGHTVWEVCLCGSESCEVSQRLLVGESSGLGVPHELHDLKIIRVDVVESVGRIIERHAVGHTNFGLQFGQTLFHCVTVQGSDALFNNKTIR